MEITSIITSDTTYTDSYKYEVNPKGIDKIQEIRYHTPMGEGDRHYCDIVFTNGEESRIFNIDQINRKPIEISNI